MANPLPPVADPAILPYMVEVHSMPVVRSLSIFVLLASLGAVSAAPPASALSCSGPAPATPEPKIKHLGGIWTRPSHAGPSTIAPGIQQLGSYWSGPFTASSAGQIGGVLELDLAIDAFCEDGTLTPYFVDDSGNRLQAGQSVNASSGKNTITVNTTRGALKSTFGADTPQKDVKFIVELVCEDETYIVYEMTVKELAAR